MLFKVFPKDELSRLYTLLAPGRIIGPLTKGHDQHGHPLFDFAVSRNFTELRLDYGQTLHFVKNFFLPYREDLCSFSFAHDGSGHWHKEVDYGAFVPLVFFGLHPCEKRDAPHIFSYHSLQEN